MTLSGVVDMKGLGLGCQTGDITSGSMQIVETWVAAADGTLVDNTRLTGEQQLELGPACLTVSGFVTTCTRVSDPFADTLGYDSVECVDNPETGGCSCNAIIDQIGGLGKVFRRPEVEGNYAVDGASLVTTLDEEETEYAYCVAGDTLAMTLTTMSRIGTVTGPLVLKKQ
jgi:hypothetical protein